MAIHGRGIRRILIAGAVLTTAFTSVVAANAAAAPSVTPSVQPATTPGPPTGEHVTTATTTSFTVVMDRATNTTGYRVAASRTASDIYLQNINAPRPGRKITTSATPTIVSAGWDYRPLTIYYRVATVNGSTVRWSGSFHETYLRPPTPSSLVVHQSDSGTYLSWSSGADRGYNIQMSTSPAFTGATSFTTADDTKYFTPSGMARGTTYYFRVRGQNGPWFSAWSNTGSGGTTTRGVPLTVLTYNVLSSHFDGTTENGNVVAPWATRVAGTNGVAALISGANPTLAAVQEAGGLLTVNGVNHPQVADILRLIGSTYAEDCTRSTTNPVGNRYAQNYLIYQPAKLTPVEPVGQACNYWNIPDRNDPADERATYEAFTVNGYTGPNGAPLKFVAISMHLTPTLGANGDAVRKAEMDAVIANATSYAASLGISLILYSGDTNSWPDRVGQSADTPGIEARGKGLVETNGAAPTHTNQQYESINGYMWTPPHGGSADRTFVTPGTMVSTWSEILHLSGGRFAGSYIPSDHNPVVSGIRLPTTSP